MPNNDRVISIHNDRLRPTELPYAFGNVCNLRIRMPLRIVLIRLNQRNVNVLYCHYTLLVLRIKKAPCFRIVLCQVFYDKTQRGGTVASGFGTKEEMKHIRFYLRDFDDTIITLSILQ